MKEFISGTPESPESDDNLFLFWWSDLPKSAKLVWFDMTWNHWVDMNGITVEEPDKYMEIILPGEE